MPTSITTGDVLIFLQILVAILLVVVLYHALFIAVDLRRILRRIESFTKQMEDVVMKPVSMIDHIFTLVIEYLEQQNRELGKGKKPKNSKKQS